MYITLTSTMSGLTSTVNLPSLDQFGTCKVSGIGSFELLHYLNSAYDSTGHFLNLEHTTLWDVLHAASDAGFTYSPVPGLKAPSYPAGVQT